MSVYLFSVVRLGLIIMTICWIMLRPMACQPLRSPFLVSCQITGFVPGTSDSDSGFDKYCSVISDDPPQMTALVKVVKHHVLGCLSYFSKSPMKDQDWRA